MCYSLVQLIGFLTIAFGNRHQKGHQNVWINYPMTFQGFSAHMSLLYIMLLCMRPRLWHQNYIVHVLVKYNLQTQSQNNCFFKGFWEHLCKDKQKIQFIYMIVSINKYLPDTVISLSFRIISLSFRIISLSFRIISWSFPDISSVSIPKKKNDPKLLIY